GCVNAATQLLSGRFDDPEGVYLMVRNLARVGALDVAFTSLGRAVEGGFYCVPAFVSDPWLEPLRADARFPPILAKAEARAREAEAEYRRAGGERLLGPPN